MCTDNIVSLISLFIEGIGDLVEQQGDVGRLHHIHEELCAQFDIEDDLCMGTDRTTFKLRKLFETVMEGIHLFTEYNSMENLLEIAIELTVVRDELASQLHEVTV